MGFLLQVIFCALVIVIIYRAIHDNIETNKRLSHIAQNLGKDKEEEDYLFVEDNGLKEEESESILLAETEEELEEVVLW